MIQKSTTKKTDGKSDGPNRGKQTKTVNQLPRNLLKTVTQSDSDSDVIVSISPLEQISYILDQTKKEKAISFS